MSTQTADPSLLSLHNPSIGEAQSAADQTLILPSTSTPIAAPMPLAPPLGLLEPGAGLIDALSQTTESAFEQQYSSNSTQTFVLDPSHYPEVFGAAVGSSGCGFGALPPALAPFDSGTQLDSAELDAYESLLLDAAGGGSAIGGGLELPQVRDLHTPTPVTTVLVDFAHTSQEWPDGDAGVCSTGTQTRLRAHPQLWPTPAAGLAGTLAADALAHAAPLSATCFSEALLPPLADSSTQTSRELIAYLNSLF